jgi:hypothetical protein
MSEDSIVAIVVAIIGPLVAFGVKLIDRRLNKRYQLTAKTPRDKKDRKTFFIRIAYFFSILIALVGVGLLYKQIVYPSTPEISITFPKNNDSIEQTTRVEGTFKNVRNQDRVWVFINPIDVFRYFPQNSFADLDANGTWTSLCYFGQDRDTGKKFEIIVVLLEKEAIKQVQNYLKDSKNRQDWSGMKGIPENSIIYERKIVVRK